MQVKQGDKNMGTRLLQVVATIWLVNFLKKLDFTSCVYSLAFIPGLTSLAVLCVGQGEGGEEISKVLGIGYIYRYTQFQ